MVPPDQSSMILWFISWVLDRACHIVDTHKNVEWMNEWSGLALSELSLLLFSHPVLSDSLQPHELQHTRPPCPSPSPRVCPHSHSLHRGCHLAISSSDGLFCPWSLPASGTFPMSHLYVSDEQNTGASSLASVLPVSIQSWSPIRWTGWISLQSKGLSGSSPAPQFKGISSLVFCLLYGPALTTVCDHWEDHSLDYMDLYQQCNVSSFKRPCLSLSSLFCQEAIIWYHGCCHHPQGFLSPRRGNLSLLPHFPLLFTMQ